MKPPLYTRPWRLGLLASVCVALACSATARQVAAQEPAPPKADPSAALRFRRVFAPADRVQDWPRDAARYVPVAPDEFERLVERARDVPPGATVSPVARTLRAVYQARFDDQVALVGQATLEIGYAGDAPAAMALEPCGLAVGDVSWQGPPKGPATLGLRDDGRLAVLVKAPGQLGFNWSLRGRRDVTGPIAFQLQLPACPATTLFLDLPEDRVPVVERGIVADKTAAGAGRLKWRIELGGLNRLALRLAPRDSGVGPPKPVHFREALTYDVSIRGVDVSAQWKLDVRGEPVRRLEVELDAGLRLLTARYGDADIAWSTLEERDSAPTRLALEFPEPVLGADRVVRLAAVAPLVADKALRLPRIRPRGVVWHEGSVALLVRAPLLINELVPSSCRQTRATPLPAPSSGESIELQCFGPDSAVQIALGRAEQPLQVSAGTTVRLIGGAASAEMVADVRSPAGEHLLMEADVPPGWNIDSVQATPPDALGDWHIDTGDGAASTLHVRLARPVSPNSPVKLQVRGQRPLSSVGGPPAAIPLADLQMLAFHGAASPLRLLALVPDESSQLRLIDAGDASLSSADRLTPYEQALLTDVEHARYLVRLSGDAQSGRVAVENAQPSYKAEVRVLASATAGRLAESYVVRCTPLARPVSRVLVRFTQSRREPLQWTTGDENPQRVHIRRIDNRPNPGDKDDPTGETWEIALTQPRAAPFELRATRSTPHLAELPVALVVLPEAIDHQARLIVDAAADIPLVVRNRGLRQVETEPVALGRYATARAAYRYEPSDAAAGLSIAPAPDAPAQHTAWAWSCQTDSRWEVDGRALHLITYRIENRGRRSIEVQLPSEFNLVKAWLDRTPVHAMPKNGQLVVALPADKAFVTLVLQGESAGPRLGWITSIEAPRLEADLPVLARRFRVWTPPGYEMRRSSDALGGALAPRLSWSQRLFGPLGRSSTIPPFDPLTATGWQAALPGENLSASESAARDFAQQLTASAAAAESLGAGEDSLDWSEFLLRSQSAASSSTPQLLVDWQALGEEGIGPRTPAPTLPARTSSGEGDSLLAHTGLRLLVCDDAAVLTTDAAAAVDRRELNPMDPGTLLRVRPGPLADQIRAAAGGASDRYLSPERWNSAANVIWEDLPAVAVPWVVDAAREATVVESAADGVLRATIIRQSLAQSAGCAVFVMVVAFSWWMLRGRGVALIAMSGAFAALALLLPEEYAALASGGVLGSLLSMLLARWVGQPTGEPARASRQPGSTSKLPLVRTAQTALLLLAGGLMAASGLPSRAQETPPDDTKPAHGEVHRVFIPVDDKNNPTGGKYQVPEVFYNELRRRAAAATSEPQGWMLQSADYRCTLVRDVMMRRALLKDLSVSLDLQVFADGTRVRLPWGGESIDQAPDGASLDGRSVALQRDADGRSLSLEVAEAGPHRLEVALRPDVRTSGDSGVLDIPIPPLANSTIELLLPADAPEIELPESLGQWLLAPDKQKLTARLGPASRLVVRWKQRTAEADAAAAIADVDELLWLHVQPGAVVLQGKFKFKVRSGRLQQLQFAVDPHLRLLPLEARESPVASAETLAGDPQTIRLELARGVTDQVTVPLKFLVTGASGVGAIDVPRLEALGVQSVRRWMALSVDPGLEFQADKLAGDQALTAADFVAQWGLVGSPPQLALRAQKPDNGWRLTTRPREHRISARQSLVIGASQHRLNVRFDAQIEPIDAPAALAGGYAFSHRLHAPPNLNVDSVSVLEEGAQRVARWARSPQGDIIVFLTAPAAAPQRLSLRGWLPSPESRRSPLPLLTLAGAEVREAAIQVWRQPEVSLEIAELAGLAEVNEPLRADETKDLGRLVGSFVVQGLDARATLAIALNEPLVRAHVATSVLVDGGNWEAKVDYRCRVENGVLDRLQFDVPADWPGPYEIVPAMPHELVPVAGERRRQLTVRPRTPVQGDFHLTLRGPLRLGAGEPLVVPDIVPNTFPSAGGETRRFFVLPTQLGSQRLLWETSGLRSASLPAELADLQSAGAASFTVASDVPKATVTAMEDLAPSARVGLADVRIAPEADGSYRGQASLDLVVAGESSCQLRMPAELDLVHITVAGAPVTPLPAADGQWTLPLVVDKPRQRVEVVFASRDAAPRSSHNRLAAPEIDLWPVSHSRWTVYAPLGAGPGDIVSASPVDDAGLEATADSEASAPPEAAVSVADATLGRWRQATHLDSPGAVSQVMFSHPLGPKWDRYLRFAAALSILAATAWLVRRGKGTLVADVLLCWPYAAGVVLGVAWWLWLSPSALGLVIAITSAIAALRDLWRGSAPGRLAGG